jgi:hypothetical protein
VSCWRVDRSRSSSVSSQASDTSSLFTPVSLVSTARRTNIPSDVESSASELADDVALEGTTKEQLYQYFRRMERRSAKYKARYTQVGVFAVVCLGMVEMRNIFAALLEFVRFRFRIHFMLL